MIPPRDVTGDDENENARWQKRHAPYWGEWGYADDNIDWYGADRT
jgi:hypothetical protein